MAAWRAGCDPRPESNTGRRQQMALPSLKSHNGPRHQRAPDETLPCQELGKVSSELQIRDALLPKPLSGEIRVRDAEGTIPREAGDTRQANAEVYTIGHSNHSAEVLLRLLKQHAITAVVDVRSVPMSKYNPQFNRDTFATFLRKNEIAYVFLGEELGARPDDPGCYEDGAADFKKMAARPVFEQGMQRLLKGAATHQIALLCAEKEPLDCHRTILVCRHLRRRGAAIKHILADGRVEDHEETERRLIKLAGPEASLFDAGPMASERLEKAYARRSREIAYRRDRKERDRGHAS